MRNRLIVFLALWIVILFAVGLAQEPPQEPPAGETPAEEPKEPPAEKPPKEKPKSPNLEPPKNHPERAVKLLNEGVELMEKAKQGTSASLDYVDQALKKFEGAVLAGPDFALAEYHRGIAFQYTQDFDEAKRVLERSLKINPNFYEAMVELGDTFAWMKDYENALKLYDRCIEMKADYMLAHRNKAIIYLRMRELDKAHENIKKAMELDVEDNLGKELSKDIELEVKGPGFAKEFVKEGEHYRIMTDVSQQFADDLAKEIEIMYRVFTNVFPKIEKEKKKFPVYVFANAQDYFKWGGPPNSGGFFSDWQQKLQFFRQKSEADTRLVLYHEAFHQFLNYYLLDCPMWFNEGHAEYFGALEYNPKDGKLYARPNRWRLEAAQTAINSGKTASLSKMIQMTHAEFYDEKTVGMNYAQAWSFVYFLWEYQAGKYRSYVRNYFDTVRGRCGLKKAYERVFGKTDMKKLEGEWKAFIQKVKLPEPKK